MIAILHGYLLDGSGSNLWTQAVVRALCRAGQTVHLVCQEPHPEAFDFVARAVRYDAQARPRVTLEREVPYPGRCVLHKPTLGPVLPVYVWDRYEEHDRVVPMAELPDAPLRDYVERNLAVVRQVLDDHPEITAIHANHAILLSLVARRLFEERRIPYAVMPHGSALEYACRPDRRLRAWARDALEPAARIFVHGPEVDRRVRDLFPDLSGLDERIATLPLGVDTALFEPTPPSARARRVRRLRGALDGLERGKDPRLSTDMRRRLGDRLGLDDLRQVLARAADYSAKHPDADVEQRLAAVDWEHDQVILFVGRLIAAKGVQAVLAALPAILEHRPRARVVVVGHGPLREPLEALLWALDTGSEALLRNIVAWGRALEGSGEPEPLVHVARFLERLEAGGELGAYLTRAREAHVSDRVVLTGYLNHDQLRHLFPCCDVAVFPSVVAETGPLVFLEALASGVFPLGIDFAGMGASIAAAAAVVPPEVADLMRLRQDPTHTVADIVKGVVGALALGRTHAPALREHVVRRHDWNAVAATLLRELEERAG